MQRPILLNIWLLLVVAVEVLVILQLAVVQEDLGVIGVRFQENYLEEDLLQNLLLY